MRFSKSVLVFLCGWEKARLGENDTDCILGILPKEIIKYIIDYVYIMPFPFNMAQFNGWKNRDQFACPNGYFDKFNKTKMLQDYLKEGVNINDFYREKVLARYIEKKGKFKEIPHYDLCNIETCAYTIS